ncbi:hypothetical protein IHE27_12240 [Mycetohabitans endofungorum]|nr:hypothetical protein [Mycetohabitans sp. B3]
MTTAIRQRKGKTRIVLELRQQYPLAGLLKATGLARSTFYYQRKALQMADKYASLKKARIGLIFDQHKGRYGYSHRLPPKSLPHSLPSATRCAASCV